MRKPFLSTVHLPDFGLPVTEPQLGRSLYQARIERLKTRMVAAELDAIVIYGDREHVANISWASGYDPRFEEALLIVTKDLKPVLFAGNEGFPYAEVADVIEDIVEAYLALRDRPEELFVDTVKRLGVEPFKERVYATR